MNAPVRKPKTKTKDPQSVVDLVLDLDRRLKGGDSLSDVLLPFEEWLALVEAAQSEKVRR